MATRKGRSEPDLVSKSLYGEHRTESLIGSASTMLVFSGRFKTAFL
jgi:hypothetical protein